jgi:amidohydrolase
MKGNLLTETKRLAEGLSLELIEWRRYLHSNPELSFEESNTSDFISTKLNSWGIVNSKIAGTGVIGYIYGTKSGSKKVIALRADMDALPILEVNDGRPYRSKVEGVMHACGHDVHTTCLLGAVKILSNLSSQFSGIVKIIFQPGEEKLPGGASLLIKEGVLINIKPQSIIGQHVYNPLEVGQAGLREGVYMASADEIYITIKGRGGHAATPQNNIDPILISAQILVALQQLVSRSSDPTIPSVLSIGKINSTGGATNVIPSEVKMEGTFRTMDESWRSEAHKKMKKIVNEISKSFGGAAVINIIKGYPVLYNEEKITEKIKGCMEEYLGRKNVVRLPIRMTAEDFAFYSQKIPGCFYRLGTGSAERKLVASVHTPEFDIDERSLEIGSGLMAYNAIRQLI